MSGVWARGCVGCLPRPCQPSLISVISLVAFLTNKTRTRPGRARTPRRLPFSNVSLNVHLLLRTRNPRTGSASRCLPISLDLQLPASAWTNANESSERRRRSRAVDVQLQLAVAYESEFSLFARRTVSGLISVGEEFVLADGPTADRAKEEGKEMLSSSSAS